jgi:proteasome lid subunit RPN8/RPN11
MSAEPGFSISPVKRSLPQDNPESTHAFYCHGPGFRLHVKETVLSSIRRQCALDLTQEAGGVLLGRHLQSEHGYVVIVSDHLPVPSQSRSGVHFSFDQSSIQAIFTRVSESADYVVGWYHSHVGGTPFMSHQDRRLHQDHFSLPWYVSCVVGAGEWGMPLDFWRLEDGELVDIDEYAMDFSPGISATLVHQGYLHACQVNEPEDPASADYVAALLSDFGFDADGPLSRVLRETQLSTVTPASRLDELRLVIDLAKALATEPATADEVTRLQQKLLGVRSLENAVSFIAISDHFRGTMAFCGSKGLFLTPGDTSVAWFDASVKKVWPVNLEAPVFAACFSTDGTAWLLTERKRIIRLTSAHSESAAETPVFDQGTLSISKLSGEPHQVAVHDDDLWLTTSERWYRIPIGSHKEGLRTGSVWDLPQEDACALVSGLGAMQHSGLLITQTGGLLRRWSPSGTDIEQVAEQALPSPWRHWRLQQACLGPNGLCLLFDDGLSGQIGLFDRDSLELKWHYLRDSERGLRQIRLAMCADPIGRTYVREAGILYRFRP